MNYTYNNNGAIIKVEKLVLGALSERQSFTLTASGLAEYFKLEKFPAPAVTPSFVSRNYWQWEYRYSPLGGASTSAWFIRRAGIL